VALGKFGKQENFDKDQESQVMSLAFKSILNFNGIQISTDGNGCRRRNVFIEQPL